MAELKTKQHDADVFEKCSGCIFQGFDKLVFKDLNDYPFVVKCQPVLLVFYHL